MNLYISVECRFYSVNNCRVELGRWNKCGASWPPCNARMEGEVAVTALTDSNFNMTAKLESMTGGESLNIFTRLHERCTVIWILFREMKFPHTHPKKIFIYIYLSLYIYIYIRPGWLLRELARGHLHPVVPVSKDSDVGDVGV
jgi:hypothetical protein